MLNFPDTPTLNQTFNGPSGIVWQWDGIKWLNSTLAKAGVDAALQNVGRNKLHNSMFNIQQRGIGPWTAVGNYTADRWAMNFVGGTLSISLSALSDAARISIGDDEARTALLVTVAGGSGATDQSYFEQRIESVRRTAGKTFTLSFWAASGSGTPKLGCALYQLFGTGGSPSAAVTVAAQAITLSVTYTRYSLTFIVPSIIGKTLGNNGDDCLYVRFWLSAGSTNSPNAGNIGVQSFVLGLWGVQLEIGTIVTPLEKLDPVMQLQQCQRFYQTSSFNLAGYTGAGTGNVGVMLFPVTMRVAPTIVPTFPTQTNCSGSQTNPWGAGFGVQIYTVGTAVGGYALVGSYTASADL